MLLYHSCRLGVCVFTTIVLPLAFIDKMFSVEEISTSRYSYFSAMMESRYSSCSASLRNSCYGMVENLKRRSDNRSIDIRKVL